LELSNARNMKGRTYLKFELFHKSGKNIK
jgi:hypothetical protein